MSHDAEDNWEENLRTHMQQLQREKAPSELLEERTVRALRRRGILRPKHRFSAMWLAGSVAAALALFASGVVLGQYLGASNAAGVFAALQRSNSADATAQVREAGSAYVQALQVLVGATRAAQSRGQDASHGREVALTALHQAANEIIRLAPNDPVAARILQGIQQEQKQQQSRPDGTARRQIVWF